VFAVLSRVSVALAACSFAATSSTQSSIAPVFEWGPGLAAHNELWITRALSIPVVPADVDRDGDVDLVQLGSWDLSGLFTVMVNNGQGLLTSRTFPPAGSASWSALGIDVGDVDGDTDLDVVFAAFVGGSGGTDRPWAYLNDGFGNYTLDFTRFARAPAARTGVALDDVDGDGDLDAVFSGSPIPYGSVELWLNDGIGYFTDVTSTHLPPNTDCESNVATGDLNGDGYPELVIGRGNGGLTSKRVLWNDGRGQFTAQVLPPNNSAYYCYLLDVDRDGDLDVFFKGGQSMLFINEPLALRQVLRCTASHVARCK
jgi:hypothetical protein